MATVAECLALVLLCAGADWLRGRDKFPGLVKKFLYAVIAAFLVVNVEDGYAGLIFIAVFIAGSSYGWGRPIGLTLGGENDPPYERWQKGILRENQLLALIVRGLMWLPVYPLYFFTENTQYLIAPIAMAVAFVASPYIARFLPFHYRWQGMEAIRGALFGVMAFGGSLWT